jgi:circadian clock protein KaiB
MRDNYELEVIDIYQQPKLARDSQIIATPTLVRDFPRPMRRFIGNMSNLAGLFGEIDSSATSRGMP